MNFQLDTISSGAFKTFFNTLKEKRASFKHFLIELLKKAPKALFLLALGKDY
jgi:hypothetical protein